jgi:hypothetical protein
MLLPLLTFEAKVDRLEVSTVVSIFPALVGTITAFNAAKVSVFPELMTSSCVRVGVTETLEVTME